MKVNLRKLIGNWNSGYALDKHMLSSTYTGVDQYGHDQFDNVRTEIGEATYQLKYKQDWSQAAPLAKAIFDNVYPKLSAVGLLIPMAASSPRPRQPVLEVTKELGKLAGLTVFEHLLAKQAGGNSLKNLTTKDEKKEALGQFGFTLTTTDGFATDGQWNALVIDDLYHTGASMEAACAVLSTHPKIKEIYVATLTHRG
ncbi:MAG: ComF family protein [Rhodoferax sp.]|jgi:predicted amidophosphoribosyltransferase|nr:ComF family protein [Rhodoferax sp.]